MSSPSGVCACVRVDLSVSPLGRGPPKVGGFAVFLFVLLVTHDGVSLCLVPIVSFGGLTLPLPLASLGMVRQ